MPRQHVKNTKEFGGENEAKRANKHANKRIIYWPPFWNKVYSLCKMVSLGQKLKMPKRCEKRYYEHIRVVVSKKPLQKTPNIRKRKTF